MKIEKSIFKDVEFMSKDDKYKVAKLFKRFVQSGFKPEQFKKRVYEHLHLHCGFIAHYNINGFYHEYFNGSKEDLKRFAEHFLNFEAMPYEDVYNGGNVNYEPYSDISKCFADILIEFDIKKQVEE